MVFDDEACDERVREILKGKGDKEPDEADEDAADFDGHDGDGQ